MAGLSVAGQMKVSTLQEGFLKEFGLTLRVYDGREFADPSKTLAQVRKKKGSGKDLSVAKNMKVGNLEDKFEEEFGLKVQVAGSDNSYLCDNNLTLNAAQQDDQKKLARKELKAARKAESNDDGDGDSLNANNAVSVCLSFDSITSTYVETNDGDWIDEEDDLSAYRFEGTSELDSASLTAWCNTNINLEFDGDLDDPDVFSAIEAVKVCGPTLAEYSPEGLVLENVSFYLSVTPLEDIDESNLDDLFHVSVPILSLNGSKMAFTEFEDYEASFEEVPNEGKSLSTSWT
jgi:hypothetical protein